MTDAYSSIRTALDAVVDGLSHSQLEKASLPFADTAARSDWAYFPRPEAGLPLADVGHRQYKLIVRLLEAGLSAEAFARVISILGADDLLDSLELRRASRVRDRGQFYLTLWTEGSGLGWRVRGWRFEGHHISINYTLGRDGIVSASPLFLGSNPARYRHDGFDIYRPLGDSEDVARELLHSLTPEQRSAATVRAEAPVDLILANLPFVADSDEASTLPLVAMLRVPGSDDARAELRFDPRRPLGIAAERLSDGQRQQLARLTKLYAGRFAPGSAWDGIESLDELHFAWAGGIEPGEPHYYRLQGPKLVVEYDNVQDGANHVHTVCRHPDNDFGAQVLALHHAGSADAP